MDFTHTQERRMLADSLARALARGADWAALADLGVPGALFTESEGGFGGAGFDIALVFEELGRAGCTLPVLEAALAGGLIADAGRADLVERIVAGGLKVTLAHAEPGMRFDPGPVTASVAGGRVSGRKAFVTQAEGAELLVVSALEGGALRLCLVDPRGPGVSLHTTPALQGGTISDLVLDRAPAEPLGDAATLEARLAAATLAVCAEGLGAMQAAMAMTLDYLRTRRQFGVPIGSFQALQHRMADLAIEVEMARAAVINLSGHLDAAAPTRDRHVSACKALVGRVARQVAEETIQMHGGIAMTAEYALGALARRLVALDHRFGDEDWHLARFIRLSA